MKKKNLLILFIFIMAIVVGLIVLGLIFTKTDEEKQNGLSNHYDVSTQETIAYVNYSDGKPQLFLFNEDTEIDELVVEYNENTLVLDPTFSSDGSLLAYITTNKNKEEELKSTVHFLDLKTKEISDVFSDSSTITEVEFQPNSANLLYLRAGTFENYSPITGKRPHNFDAYQYEFNEKNHKRLTNLDQYSMQSLQVSPDGQRLYFQTLDDSAVETAEDSFHVKQRIFEVSIEHPDLMTVISDPNREVDIFSFALSPKGDEFIFQSISNYDEGGTFEYELYSYQFASKEEKQLTRFGEYTSDPVVHANGTTIYFMLDTNFAKGNPHYHLYKMSSTGQNATEISLPIK